jgi:replication-associated recombination protein RarA
MKLTKSHIKQLIKEELQNVLNEGCKDEPQTYSAYLQTLAQAIQKIKAGDTKMAITLLTGMLQAMKTNP